MRMLFALIAIGAGLTCGWFDLHSGNTLLTAGYLAAAAFLLALAKPSFAWMCATLVGLGVPAVYLWATLSGAEIPYPPTPTIAATLLALLPAVAAALFALALRRLVVGAARAMSRDQG
jgi:hypothetical protein